MSLLQKLKDLHCDSHIVPFHKSYLGPFSITDTNEMKKDSSRIREGRTSGESGLKNS